MLEAYTTLGYLAAAPRGKLHVLATAVVYREPGLLASGVTTSDALSGGRAGLGIGAAWNEEEAEGPRVVVPVAPQAAVRAPRGGGADLRADVERQRRAVRGPAPPLARTLTLRRV